MKYVYEALVEQYQQESTEVYENKPGPLHFIRNKSHTYWLGWKAGHCCGKPATNRLSHGPKGSYWSWEADSCPSDWSIARLLVNHQCNQCNNHTNQYQAMKHYFFVDYFRRILQSTCICPKWSLSFIKILNIYIDLFAKLRKMSIILSCLSVRPLKQFGSCCKNFLGN
jgi:hypothetical protein